MQEQKDRILWIDRMRGLAIVSVVIQHLTIGMFLNPSDMFFLKFISLVNMGVFFFISGFILNKTSKIPDIRKGFSFIKKKTLQIFVPFLIWPLLVDNYFCQADWNLLTYSDIIAEFKEPHLWFLLTLFGYCFWFVMYKLISNSIKEHRKILSLLYWFIPFLLLSYLSLKMGFFKSAALYIIYFAGGAIVENFSSYKNIFINKYTYFIALLCILLLTSLFVSGHTSLINILVKIIVTFSAILLIYYFSSQFDWNSRFDSFILRCGKYSLAIYVLHWYFLIDLLNNKFTYVSDYGELIVFIVVSIYGFLICNFCILIKDLISKLSIVDLILFGTFHKRKVN